jgi:hypothetical protein
MSSTSAIDPALGALPEWDLDDLYPGRDSADLAGDLDRVGADAAAFRKRYHDKVGVTPTWTTPATSPIPTPGASTRPCRRR